MIGGKGAGYARTGRLEQGLGVFMWAAGSDVDDYMESLRDLDTRQKKAGRPILMPLNTTSTS